MLKSKEIYKELTKRVGNIFYSYRNKKNLSLREVYRKTSVSIAVISDMETGKKLPRIETLISLCRFVDIPLSEIFSDKLVSNDWKFIPFSSVKNRKKRNNGKLIKLPFGYELKIRSPFKIGKEVSQPSSYCEFPEEVEY